MTLNEKLTKKLQSIMNDDAKSYTGRLSVVRHDAELLSYVYEKTNFLVDSDSLVFPLTTRIRFVLSGLSHVPKCPTCGGQLKFIESKKWFQHHCCPSCAFKDVEVQNKRENTCYARYGAKSFNNHEKQKETMLERYGVQSALCNSKFRERGKETKKIRYGSKNYNNPEKATRTCEERYGVGNGRNHKKAVETMIQMYGVDTYLTSAEVNAMRNNKEIQRKIQETKRKRHTFRVSSLEEECYSILVSTYGKEDVVRQFKSKEYPYLCDFYIPSKKLYIEFNGHWSHGKHAFDKNSEEDNKIATRWMNKGTEFYKKSLWVWTVYDVEKRNVAKKAKIYRKEFWSITELKNFLKGERT